jgi:hypothetical protein
MEENTPSNNFVDSESISYTAAQLIQSAEHLYSIDDPRTVRASVLEAVAALESKVNDCVINQLDAKLGPILSKWIEERTRMDFDARLSILLPVATGLPVDKKGKLWVDYKKAKDIRNKIAHTGKRITKLQARKVIDAVYEWLNYLGSATSIPEVRTDMVKFSLLGRFLAAWARLERAIYEEERKDNIKGEFMIKDNISKYYAQGIDDLSIEETQELKELRKLRNSLVHGKISNYEIIDESDIDRIENIIKKIKNKKNTKQKKK